MFCLLSKCRVKINQSLQHNVYRENNLIKTFQRKYFSKLFFSLSDVLFPIHVLNKGQLLMHTSTKVTAHLLNLANLLGLKFISLEQQ